MNETAQLKVGDTWKASGGTREIALIQDGKAFVRESEHAGVVYHYPLSDIPELQARDAANLATHIRWEAENEVRLAEEAKARSLDGWEATLSPMALGRAQTVLGVQVLYRGVPMSRRDIVRLGVSEGAKPGDGCLEWEDGRFLRMPKLAVDYARHLISPSQQ